MLANTLLMGSLGTVHRYISKPTPVYARNMARNPRNMHVPHNITMQEYVTRKSRWVSRGKLFNSRTVWATRMGRKSSTMSSHAHSSLWKKRQSLSWFGRMNKRGPKTSVSKQSRTKVISKTFTDALYIISNTQDTLTQGCFKQNC